MLVEDTNYIPCPFRYCCTNCTSWDITCIYHFIGFLLQSIDLVAICHEMYCRQPGHRVSSEFVLQSHHMSRARCAYFCMSDESCGSFNYDDINEICHLIGHLTEDVISCNSQTSEAEHWYSPQNCGSKEISGNTCRFVKKIIRHNLVTRNLLFVSLSSI